MEWLKRFLSEESGPTAVEYAVMLALIIVVCLGSIFVLGKMADTTFNQAGHGIVGGMPS